MVDAAVIGGGHNGLACAALLAKAGLSVAVFERRERIGGAAVSESVWPGYTVSTASYVCTLLDPWLIDELDLRAYGYDAYRKEPATFNVMPDGRSLLLGRDDAENARELARFDRGDILGYARADAYLRKAGAKLFDTFTDREPSFSRFDPQMQAFLRGSAADFVEHHVKTPVLQAAIATDGIIGTFAGPRDPGTGYVLAHHYAGRALGVQGAWGYVRGGMGAVSQALGSAARAYGATIYENASVAQVIVDDGTAAAVVLEDGTEVRARFIASNAHPYTTFLSLVGDQHFTPHFSGRVRAWKTTGVAFKLNLALGELPDFRCRPGTRAQPHHRATIHVAPSLDYLQDAYEDARAGSISKMPMLECFLQTPTDPTLAPPGKHILSIFAQYYPYNRDDGWGKAQREAVADRIIYHLAQYAPNVPDAIEDRQMLSPVDLEERFGLIGGHIFHGELLPGQIYEDRFSTRTPIRNLYLCGSGAHPGGCVSGIPGRRAAQAILADAHAQQAAR